MIGNCKCNSIQSHMWASTTKAFRGIWHIYVGRCE